MASQAAHALSPLREARTHRVRVGDVTVAVHELGDGPPLCLLHGLGSSALAWSRAMPSLAMKRRVLAFDLPGCGDSDKPHRRFGLGAYADIVFSALEHLGVPAAPWAGHSMGAQISMVAALARPEAIPALSLVSPAGIERFSKIERWMLEKGVTRDWVRKQNPRQLKQALELAFHRVPAEADWLLQRRLDLKGAALLGYAYAFSGGVQAMLEAPVHQHLGELSMPTQVLFGAEDRLVPNRMMHPMLSPRRLLQTATKRIPRSDAQLIPETGHLLPFEAPHRVAAELLGFLSNTSV